ncbi:hypothetical protein GCM10010174_63820 [Kutzneria viridogrisea]
MVSPLWPWQLTVRDPLALAELVLLLLLVVFVPNTVVVLSLVGLGLSGL